MLRPSRVHEGNVEAKATTCPPHAGRTLTAVSTADTHTDTTGPVAFQQRDFNTVQTFLGLGQMRKRSLGNLT